MLKYYTATFKAMGSCCEIRLYAKTPAKAQRAIDVAMALISRLEQRYSRYINDNVMFEINQAGRSGYSINVDDETAALLDYADVCYQNSDGLFDISSGILREVWDFKSNCLPDKAMVERLLERVGWKKIAWEKPLLSFGLPGMELDFGGIVKEFAADQCAVLLLEKGIQHGLINLGGDIRVIGPHPDNKPWEVGIRHPRNKDDMTGSINICTGGISSSGDYERCIKIDGHNYSHILNPKTGWPVSGLASVTVIADFCLVAGSASTIAMLKEEDGATWLKDNNFQAWCVDINGNFGPITTCGDPSAAQ
jgi:thiamine biosynthesis lipoprotein